LEKEFDVKFIDHNTAVLSLLSIPECTSKEPIRFFDKIIPENLLDQMLVEFVRKSSEMDEIFNIKSDCEVVQTDYIVIKRAKIGDLDFVRKFSMAEMLESIFDYHLHVAYYFIKEKAEGETLIKSKKEFFHNIVLRLKDRWFSVRRIEHYSKFIDVYSFPFEALIFFIYNEYPIYAPKKSHEINDIFLNSEKSKHFYENRNLKISVIDDIMSLCDKKGKKVWKFYDYVRCKLYLKYFIYGQYDKMSEPIEFSQNAEAAYYLIFKLIQFTGKTESEKELPSIFKINGKMYSAKSSYTAKNKIYHRTNSFKELIDNTIFSNLS
jgi:hypothetical protein